MELSSEKFPSNSYQTRKTEASKETTEERRPKQVAKVVRTKKRSLGKRISETFLADDVRNVKSYLFTDIIVPSIIESIVDVVQSGIEMVFGVDRNHNSRRSRRRNSESYTSYSMSYNNKSDSRYKRVRNSDGRFAMEEIIVETRGEAEQVINDLSDLCEDYGAARVADLYSMVGITPEFTAEKWGWESLSGARVVRQRGGGYLVDLPRPIYLE